MVTIAVRATGANPFAVNDAYSTDENTLLTKAAGQGVLSNDAGTVLTAAVVSGPVYGTVVLNSNGSFTYTPGTDFSGRDSFIYQAHDNAGALSNLGLVTLTVRGNTTTAVSSSADPSVFGQAVPFTATVTPATATGTVQFKIDGTNSGSAILNCTAPVAVA